MGKGACGTGVAGVRKCNDKEHESPGAGLALAHFASYDVPHGATFKT